MDRDALQAQGLHPGPARPASVDGYRLHIGNRAALAREQGSTVWGVVMALPNDEVERLYGEPSVADYRPEAVLARLADGGTTAALCYNHQGEYLAGSNKVYAEALHALAEKIVLPKDYIAFLEQLTK